MKAVNIKWDTDGNIKLLKELPTEIEIPDELAEDVVDMDDYNDEIGDYLSDLTGFCHYGFELVDKNF